WLFASRPGSWVLARILHHIDKIVFQLSRGRQTAASALAGIPTIMVTMKGAKSGKLRDVPLLGTPDGERYILIGSNFGQRHHPGWVYNLRANPNVTVALDGKSSAYRAREVKGEEREECWKKGLRAYSGYVAYDLRAGREIAVFVLEPAK
ncbi:MAG TPA: nitroreductase family deazaflavin-dependent oxidoreductase, partial [Anaerolineales bacterium]|nr:nitroreductase family deazaflavin-dependent oxidoreductase [Anaerolineales bacterium]